MIESFCFVLRVRVSQWVDESITFRVDRDVLVSIAESSSTNNRSQNRSNCKVPSGFPIEILRAGIGPLALVGCAGSLVGTTYLVTFENSPVFDCNGPKSRPFWLDGAAIVCDP